MIQNVLVRYLSAESMVLFVTIMRDASGQTCFPLLVAEQVSAASSVPVYGVAANHLEKGLLGGAMQDYSAHGRAAGVFAVARLNGQSAVPQGAASNPLQVNWRALKKWRNPERRAGEEAKWLREVPLHRPQPHRRI